MLLFIIMIVHVLINYIYCDMVTFNLEMTVLYISILPQVLMLLKNDSPFLLIFSINLIIQIITYL
jgi:hypothetical protein